jgi:lantibiotic modifying enzyme
MLYAEDRHEPVTSQAWDEARAREAIHRIAAMTESAFTAKSLWPAHPQDGDRGGPAYMLYMGACGVIWALRYLETQGAVKLSHDYQPHVRGLLEPNRAAMEEAGRPPFGSYLMGDTSILMLDHWFHPADETADEIAHLVAANTNHPTRELMWGAPGTLLAALFMHRRTGEERWAQLFRETARVLWSQLQWSEDQACHYWTQDMYGQRFTFIDSVHGFVGTASPLIQGRHLLDATEWEQWRTCIANTVRRNADREGDLVNWRAKLDTPREAPKLMQYCHGAPGFIISLADFPDDSLDDLLEGGALATWQAGPLRKGSNLCHGTGGNGYAFLKMYRRTGDAIWLERARAFAMHGIAQTEEALAVHGRPRHSLWTGDPGFAIYLWDCIRATDRFPTLDVFFG